MSYHISYMQGPLGGHRKGVCRVHEGTARTSWNSTAHLWRLILPTNQSVLVIVLLIYGHITISVTVYKNKKTQIRQGLLGRRACRCPTQSPKPSNPLPIQGRVSLPLPLPPPRSSPFFVT